MIASGERRAAHERYASPIADFSKRSGSPLWQAAADGFEPIMNVFFGLVVRSHPLMYSVHIVSSPHPQVGGH